MITQILKKYHLDRCSFRKEAGNLTNGFLLRLRLSAPVTEQTQGMVYEIPGCISVVTRYLSWEDSCKDWGELEHYSSYPDETGNVPILEASLFLDVPYRPNWTELKLGIPLTMYDLTREDLVILYDGMHFQFLYDGIPINENFPNGTLQSATGNAVLGSNLAHALISLDLDQVETSQYTRTLNRSIHCYSPAGHSAWAGDVVNLWHDGVYHLLFLYDHHHHWNRWGSGVHYFYHMTTTDFINWTDHGPVFEIEEPWQAFGTGTPFFYDGKFWFAVGYHTSRSFPEEMLYASHMIESHKETGYTEAISHDEIRAQGMYPNGANLAVSEDGGFTYQLTHQMFHWAENPSVYTKPDGTLFMCVGDGLWEAAKPEGPWKLTRPGFPPQGRHTPLHYTSECPSFFEKDGFQYIVMGVRGYWRTAKNSDEFIDCAVKGEDIYDGLFVPMAANCNGRLLLAGWIFGIGWGSVIIHRELIQYEDGRLGMKWLPEAAPAKDNLLYRSEDHFQFDTDPKSSYYYEIEVNPDPDGVVRVIFGDECELRLDAARKEVQVSPVGADRILPMHERVGMPDEAFFAPDTHCRSVNFTIANVDCIQKPYLLRISQYVDVKMHATLIDAEIGGCRTILSNRVHSSIDQIRVLCDEGSSISSLSVYDYQMDRCL